MRVTNGPAWISEKDAKPSHRAEMKVLMSFMFENLVRIFFVPTKNAYVLEKSGEAWPSSYMSRYLLFLVSHSGCLQRQISWTDDFCQVFLGRYLVVFK